MKKEFDHHIEKLLEQKIIRPSKSPHRTSAFIVKKHAELIRGESRMVFNYKRLNDNTIGDSYSIPSKKVLIYKI